MLAAKDELFTRPSGSYTIGKSVRLRSSASGYFNRTPASASNRTTWTWSGWVKFGLLGNWEGIFQAGATGNPQFLMYVYTDYNLYVQDYNGTNNIYFQTNQVFRDPSAWYHIVLAVDTTQATSTNRVKLYINGSQVTSFASATYPAQNFNTQVNSTASHFLGNGYQFNTSTSKYFDGYLTEINFIDGQQLTPSSFGSTNTTTGVWQPAKYTSTYGTNGFYLNFSSNGTSAALGTDFSGNSNTWTVNNISVTAGTTYDSMTDVPTLTSATAANYAVFNPLAKGSIVTISDGNLKYSSNGASGTNGLVSFYITNGMKSYFEFTCGSAALYRNVSVGGMYYAGDSGLIAGGTGGTGTFATWTTNDVIAFACDFTAGTVACYKNNTLQTTVTGVTNTSDWAINAGQAIGLGEYYFNAGQQGFKYTPPTGYVALNTYNLPTSTITNGAAYMAATTWTGVNTSAAITISNAVNGVSFQPDLVWEKPRSLSYTHSLSNSVVGVNTRLNSAATSAEETNFLYGYTSSFNSDGFTASPGSTDNENWNQTSATYVAWQWKAGGTSSSNTNGSITSTVSAGATQGFSVVTYTGIGSAATVGHGLGVAPAFIIAKSRNNAVNWITYHVSTGNSAYMNLNTTNASASLSNYWGTSVNSSTFGFLSNAYDNANGNMVAYCFAPVAGYSAFGSYTGNGSSDGPFVYCGFRPRFVMVKRTDAAGNNWVILDTSRDTYNASGLYLYPNLSAAEDDYRASAGPVDILSNGFKQRSTLSNVNASGGTYIYMAFAENPFKNSLAR